MWSFWRRKQNVICFLRILEYRERDTKIGQMMDPQRQLEVFQGYQLEFREAAGLDDTKMHG